MEFIRSSFCADKACVEVADGGGRVLVRDSKDPGAPVLELDRSDWLGFLEAVLDGEYADL